MSRKDPMMIAEIMKKNFKGAFSNPIVVIVLIGVIILPSLYALLNIQACWDPYGNTGDVPFAIANLDEGASFNDKDINQRPHGLQPTRPLQPWDFPGKSTGVGCHCLLRLWV